MIAALESKRNAAHFESMDMSAPKVFDSIANVSVSSGQKSIYSISTAVVEAPGLLIRAGNVISPALPLLQTGIIEKLLAFLI